jgi:hypothetical protein
VRRFSASSNPQVGGPSFVGCLWLFIKYMGSYLPYVEAVSYIRNQRKLDALVTGIDDIWYICELQVGWHPVAVVQLHLHTNNTKNNTNKNNI